MPGPKPKPIPSKEELEAVYPRLTLQDAAAQFGIGQTLFLRWLEARGIPRTKAPRKARSEGHKRHISEALKARPRKPPKPNRTCPVCGKAFYLQPSLLRDVNYCSTKCRGKAHRSKETSKVCKHCGRSFDRRQDEPAGNFSKRQYCSEECRLVAVPPPVIKGEDHPRWKGEDARRRNRQGPFKKWRQAVLQRDSATCQRCGATGLTLVAHHILPYETHPDKRWDVDNGLTLCQQCHFQEHGYNLKSEGIREVADERGVIRRQWTGHCLNCGKFLARRASDLRRGDGSYRNYAFCDYSCKQEFYWKAKKAEPNLENFSAYCERAAQESNSRD